MEQVETKKKNSKFIPIQDRGRKDLINELVNPVHKNGTHFIFWYGQATDVKGNVIPDKESWGLTIKQTTEPYNPKGSNSQYVWKFTWFFDAETEMLTPAKHCASLCQAVSLENSAKVAALYNEYRSAKK